MKRVNKSLRIKPILIGKIQGEADKRNRSFNNIVETILSNVLNEEEELNKLLGY